MEVDVALLGDGRELLDPAGLLIAFELILPPLLADRGQAGPGPVADTLFTLLLVAGMAAVWRAERRAVLVVVVFSLVALPIRWIARLDPDAVYAHTGRIEGVLLVAVAYVFLELVLITAVAILFSSFSPPILSSLFALAFYLIGHLSWGLELVQRKMRPGAGRTLVRALYAVLPDLENFNFKTEVVHGLPIPSGIYLSSLLYGLCYTVFILALAILVFRRRDFV